MNGPPKREGPPPPETDFVVDAPINDGNGADAPRSRASEHRPARASNGPPPISQRLPGPDEPVSAVRRQLEYWRDKALELDRLVFEMRALLQSGKGFSEILNVEQLLAAFMAVCRERYGAATSTVLLLDDLDPDNVFYRVRASFGVAEWIERGGVREELLMFKIPHDQGLLWQLIHQGDVFSVRDMQRMPRFKTVFRRWSLDVLASDVWVPLVRGSTVLGILTLGECEDGSQIPEREFDFLKEIAAVAATNIDSALKYEKNARILKNLQTLYDVNQQLANVNDFKELTIDTLASAVDAVKAQKANLMLYNPETGRLEIKVVWGSIPKDTLDAINDGRLETRSFAIGEGVAGRAAQLKKPVRINDRRKIQQVGRNIVYCILAAPLLHGGELMGVMTITNKVKSADERTLELDTLGRFGEDDEQLLLGLADQAAVNLHKARLYAASITDRLTGLHNARHFEVTLELALDEARRTGKPLALVIVDIDHFKQFNDAHGHDAGDAVLATTARLLAEAVRPGSRDTAFRYGGEELCLVLPDTDAEAAAELAESYRRKVETTHVVHDGEELRVTVSIGVASFPEAGSSRVALFQAADGALYESKRAGRNRVTVAADP